jgi:hypothetical protein
MSLGTRISPVVAGLAGLLVLTGCMGARSVDDTPARVVAQPVDELPAQTLAPGDCGLFLWTLAEPRRFVFFERAGDQNALFHVDGQTRTLSVGATEGALLGAFATRRALSASDGTMSASLELTPGEALDGGQGISAARMTLTRPDGWRVVLPLAGVYACQPA